MINICCVTGTRADYPRIRSVLKILNEDTEFNLQLIVTGSHLLDDYGLTINEIKEDGFHINKIVPMYIEDYDTPHGMTRCVAHAMKGLSDAYHELQPDVMLITVDRVETLAAASAAALMNLTIFHVQGGEVTGTIDESIRHAVTKLSHVHFAATDGACQRIIKMGEIKGNVYNTGCPYIDELSSYNYISKEELSILYGLSFNKPSVILTLHSVTTEFEESFDQISEVLDALKLFDIEILGIYSNADAGGKKIIELLKQQDGIILIPNIKSNHFASLMKHCTVMVGNSSAGIREAPTFGLPVINIGSRQNGRERGINVLDCEFKKDDIVECMKKVLFDKEFSKKLNNVKNIYGDGKSAERIVSLIKMKVQKGISAQKLITY